MTTTQADIDRWFSHHPPTVAQTERYARIRAAARHMAETLAEAGNADSPEQAEAMWYLRMAVMAANAGIACNEPDNTEHLRRAAR